MGICARYQASPKKSHLIAVNKIIKYVNRTTKFGIWFTDDSTTNLMGYYDTDWVGNYDNRKKHLRGCLFLGNNLVSWFSKKKKKKNFIPLSTTEDDYIVAGSNYSQLIRMNHMQKDYGVSQDGIPSSMRLYCDNLSAINISKNLVQHSRKNISISAITLSKVWLKKN